MPLSPSVSFKKSRLVGANFTGKELSGMEFSGAVLEGWNERELSDCIFFSFS